MPRGTAIRYVEVTYSDSHRPGAFLTVDIELVHVNHGVTSFSVFSLETDVYGRARLVGELEASNVAGVSVRRGQLVFAWDAKANDLIGPTLSIEIRPEQWPEPLKTLRALLAENRAELASAAVTTLQALAEDGVVGKLIDPGRADEYPDTDNPHIFVGALLAALSITRYFLIGDIGSRHEHHLPIDEPRDHFHAVQSGINGILDWLAARQHPEEPGYLVRWKQQDPDDRSEERNWKAEPSLDEYSGLVLGLSWASRMLCRLTSPWQETPPSPNAQRIGEKLGSIRNAIGQYLTRHGGWLVRPGYNDLTVRGPDLIANAYPLSRVFAFHASSPLRCTSELEEVLERSAACLELLVSVERSARETAEAARKDSERASDPEVKSQFAAIVNEHQAVADRYAKVVSKYAETIDPLDKVCGVEEDVDFVRWAGRLVEIAGGVALGLTLPLGVPFVAVLALLGVGAGAAAVGLADFANKKIDSISDADIWRACGTALGPPAAVDAGDYNVAIFDRFSIAACHDAVVFAAFQARAKRRIGGDRLGWQVMGMASRLFFGADAGISGTEYWVEIQRNYRALVPEHEANLETIEGFVLGWSLMALALDLDPAVDWRTIISHRFPGSELDGLVPLPSRPSRLTCVLGQVEVLTAFGPYANPHLWLIPVFLESTLQGRKLRLLPVKIARGPERVAPGEPRIWRETFAWESPRSKPDDLVFLMIVGFDAIELVKDLPAEPGEPAGVDISYLTADDDMQYAVNKFLAEAKGVLSPDHSFEHWDNLAPQIWDVAARRLGRHVQMALLESYRDTYVGASLSRPVAVEGALPLEATLCSPEGEPYTSYRISGSVSWEGDA